MTYPKAPPYHVWEQVEVGLWKCRYCAGWQAGKLLPDQEAKALSEDAARSKVAGKGETK